LGVLVVDGRKQNALEGKGIYYVILDWIYVGPVVGFSKHGNRI
jgi:hypothetical protein